MNKLPSERRWQIFASWAALFCFCLVFTISSTAVAGEWQVIPIRLELDQANRSGVLSVTNGGETPLTVKVEAFEWVQDEEGKDQYEKSLDLIFFPKTLTIGPGKERVIRTGIKVPAVSSEKTYRLFLEESPEGRTPAGTGVALAIRFGVPIFSRPVREDVAGEVGPLALRAGELQIPVTNTGNMHFRINTIHLTGTDAAGNIILDQEQNGWYLLHGAARIYLAEVPEGVCLNLKSIAVQVKTDRLELNGTTHVDPAMCHSNE